MLLTKIKSLLDYKLNINQNLTPKEFYERWQPSITRTKLKQYFFDEIEEHSSVFEFGCHNGLNLEWIQSIYRNVDVFGIDLNRELIREGQKKGRNYITYGHEGTLKHFRKFDIVFTASVLCHIEEVDKIISELIRISNRRVVLIETIEKLSKYYFPHDYKKHGFIDTRSIRNSTINGNGALYTHWELEHET